MKQVTSLLLWQGAVTTIVIVFFAVGCRIPFISKFISNKEIPILGTVFILCAWVVVGAVMSIWVDSWFVYVGGSFLLGLVLMSVSSVLLSYVHASLMNAAGPATMALMFPFVIGIFAYPFAGVIRLVLRILF